MLRLTVSYMYISSVEEWNEEKKAIFPPWIQLRSSQLHSLKLITFGSRENSTHNSEDIYSTKRTTEKKMWSHTQAYISSIGATNHNDELAQCVYKRRRKKREKKKKNEGGESAVMLVWVLCFPTSYTYTRYHFIHFIACLATVGIEVRRSQFAA